MKSICLIPARGGSKRIPKKNIKNFYGKPLIAWSIECAINTKIFDKVYVSTDDEEIANISKSYGAEIPFIRPKEISNDYANDNSVRDHFLSWCSENNTKIKILCYLYPTAPFITESTLIGCRNMLVKNNVSKVFTISKYSNSPFRALQINKDNTLDYIWPEFMNTRSQNLRESYYDAAQCYFFGYFEGLDKTKIMGYEIPNMECHDIDTLNDFDNAEMKFSILLKKGIIKL